MESGTAVAEEAPRAELIPVTENPIRAMERAWPEEDRDKLARFLGIAGDHPAFIPFLAIASELGLNPFTGDIWLIEKKKKGRDGAPDEVQYSPAVGRDGLLKIARDKRRHPEYKGFRANVVCENDDFEVVYDDSPDEPRVLHSQRKAAGAGDEWRGKILGAWCKVELRDAPSVYYFATLREHGQFRQTEDGGYWLGAWDYTSAMILKAAVSYAHRIATGVSGFVPADELRPDGGSFTEGTPEHVEVADLGKDVREALAHDNFAEELIEELVAAVREANELAPFSWGPSKIQMRLKGRPESAVRQVLQEIREDVAKDRARTEAAAEKVEDAVQVCRAEDVQPGMEVRYEEGVGDFIHVDDVVGDAESGITLILEGQRTRDLDAADEVEVRTPAAG